MSYPFWRAPTFHELLTPEARDLYFADPNIDFDGPKPLADLRYLYVVVELAITAKPGLEEWSVLAEMFNHGVARGIFTRGVFGNAKWRRMAKGRRALLILLPFSSMSQDEISDIYEMKAVM